jgi:uncharacterized membrane protein YeaQ/YmgE (transglycosylase-associated protein family)
MQRIGGHIVFIVAASNLLVGGPNVVAWLILGGLAGTIAGRLLYGRAFGFIGNIILGLIGALVGGEVSQLFFPNGFRFWGSLIIATLGSFVVVWIWGTITNKQSTRARRA